MNIMQICSGTGVNGAVVHSLLLSRELVRRGHRVTMVCRPGAWIGEQLACDPVEVIRSDLRRWPPDQLRRIAAVVRQRRIDVVHTHMSSAHFFGVLLRWLVGVPCVATAQSRHFQLHWMFNDRVVAVSDATRRYHQRRNFVRASRIETIPNFVDHRCLSEVSRLTRDRVRGSFGLDDSSPLIGIVGDVIPRKGLIYLVKAMPQILAAVPDTRLLVVGRQADADYAADVKAAAERGAAGANVLWAGHRDDVHQMLAAMDLCVLPSLEESLPLAILEAMAAGLPVVATTVGGIPECVSHGVTGTLVPPADSDALAAAIVALLRDPRQRRTFGESGRARVRDHFSSQSQTPRIEAVFDRARRRRAA